MKKLITTFLLIFICTTAYCQQNLLKVVIDDFSGGQNSVDSALKLNDNQGTSVKNSIIKNKGKISKRKGQGLFCKDVGSTAFRGLGRFDPDTSTSYMVAASGTSIIRATSSDSTWTIANPSNPLSSGYDTGFTQANDFLFIYNGQDNTAWYNGSLWGDGLGWASSSPPTATVAAWLRNYLFMAGNPTYPDWLYFSNNLAPKVFDVTDIIKINTGDGQAIQQIVPFRLNELIIYKERSIFVLDITGTTPLDDWTVQPISKDVGTIASRSVVSLGNDQWFLSSHPIAVRSLARTEFDKILVHMVSAPIQDIFDGTGDTTINTTHISKAAAILFDNKYILAVPTGSSSVNNVVLVYDFLVNSWYIIDGWYPKDWLVFENSLYYTDANDGRVIQCFTGTTGDWSQGPSTIDSASTPTAAIDLEFASKAYDFDLAENYKQLDSIEVEFEPTGNYSADLYINLDEAGWQDVGDIVLSGNATVLPTYLPFTLTSEGIARQTLQLTQYGEFKQIEVKIIEDDLSEDAILRRATIFARPKPWRRE